MARGQQPQREKGKRRAVYVHMDPEVYDKLLKKAVKERRSVSAMLAEIARIYFTKKEETRADASAAG